MHTIIPATHLETLTELHYLRNPGSNPFSEWKDVPEKEKDIFRQRTRSFFDDMAKVGYEPRPLGESHKDRQRLSVELDKLTNFIREWIKKNIEVPRNLDQVFPCREIAMKIIREFTAEIDLSEMKCPVEGCKGILIPREEKGV